MWTSDPELLDWLMRLAPTNPERLTVVTDLLRNASEDEMSGEDRSICAAAYTFLVNHEIH